MEAAEGNAILLSADHPQIDPSHDLLAYSPFAKMLAQSVLRGSPAAGLVVGIYGEWGIGKTTVLNFIEHFVNADADDDAPIVVRFNPWWFSGREDLLRRFFSVFEAAVLKLRARNTRVREALRKFGDAVGNVPFTWIAGVGKVVAAATKFGQPADIVGLRDALVQALGAEALRVIVLVDDIDRLLPSEMIEVFRLVRSVGDFPNVHYVLAFDRRVVSKAISDECRTDGLKYLEKIIQVPFELPRPNAGALHAWLTRRLNEILLGTDEKLFEQKYWSEMFLEGIAPLIRTPRDVGRLTNALAVIYPSLRNEVNPVDFVAIETLRIFAPDAYEVVRSNRAYFVGLLLSAEHRRNELREFHERWLAGVTTDQRSVEALVTKMFPAIAAILAKTGRASANDASLRRARRICAEPLFDVYFRYSFAAGLSRSAFLATVGLRGAARIAELQKLGAESLDDGRTKLRWFLEMLRDELSEAAFDDSRALVQALCSLGDLVIARTPSAFTFEVPDDYLLVFVIEKLVETLPQTERSTTLRTGLELAGVSTTAMVVMFLGAQHGRYGNQASAPEERTIESGAELDALERLARQRIENSSQDGSLWTAPRFPRLLFDWIRLGGSAPARGAVRVWCADNAKLIELLRKLSLPGGRGGTTFDMTNLAAVLELEDVARRAASLLEQPTVEPETRAILLSFQTAYASTESLRLGERARSKVLRGVLAEIARTSWYPTVHWVRTTFEAERAVIDQITTEKLLSNSLDGRYVVTIGGLLSLGDDTLARGELRASARLLGALQDAYRANPEGSVDLEQLSRRTGEPDLDALRRAAVALLLQVGGRSTIRVDFGGDGRRPTIVTAGDGILDVSPNSLEGDRTPSLD